MHRLLVVAVDMVKRPTVFRLEICKRKQPMGKKLRGIFGPPVLLQIGRASQQAMAIGHDLSCNEARISLCAGADTKNQIDALGYVIDVTIGEKDLEADLRV
jgi:hypothetical protein